MAWVAVNKSGDEMLFTKKPEQTEDYITWDCGEGKVMFLPKGTIFKLIDEELTHENEPVYI